MTTTPSEPINQPSQQPEDLGQARIVNPIDMARARHASLHGSSVLDKTRQVPVAPAAAASAKEQPAPGRVTAAVAARPAPPTHNSLFGSLNSCLMAAFIGIAFIVGGVLGGVVGGGLLLWTNGPAGLALAGSTPTVTPLPTPTPAPAATSTPTATPEPIITPVIEDVIAQIIPSVVTVINRQQYALASNPEEGRIVGSGVIVDSYGYIATNNHVVENAGNLSVILADGREVMAELIAADPSEDLAILKVSLENLPAIKWGDASTVRLGQAV
ncbi:MAG: trypsin-like peptidase domain-containing protein, partial [Chloroflexota bacterium]